MQFNNIAPLALLLAAASMVAAAPTPRTSTSTYEADMSYAPYHSAADTDAYADANELYQSELVEPEQEQFLEEGNEVPEEEEDHYYESAAAAAAPYVAARKPSFGAKTMKVARTVAQGTEDFSKGIVDSLKQTAVGTTKAVMHPVDSAKSMAHAAGHLSETGRNIVEQVKEDFRANPSRASGHIVGNVLQATVPVYAAYPKVYNGVNAAARKVTGMFPSVPARITTHPEKFATEAEAKAAAAWAKLEDSRLPADPHVTTVDSMLKEHKEAELLRQQAIKYRKHAGSKLGAAHGKLVDAYGATKAGISNTGNYINEVLRNAKLQKYVSEPASKYIGRPVKTGWKAIGPHGQAGVMLGAGTTLHRNGVQVASDVDDDMVYEDSPYYAAEETY